MQGIEDDVAEKSQGRERHLLSMTSLRFHALIGGQISAVTNCMI